jgi:TRAP-type C4-dicarboxylate transport system substrate-binding protein
VSSWRHRPTGVFLARKYYDVQKYTTNAGMLNATFGFIVVNSAWWAACLPT